MFKNAGTNKKAFTLITVMALAMAALFTLGGCEVSTTPSATLTPKVSSGTTITDGTLTVGVNASNSPYGGVNSSGETVGYDVDVAAAIADELGLKLQVVDVNSNGRSALTNKQVDIALGQTKTGDADTVTYSPAYINDGTAVFCLEKNKPASIADIDVSGEKILVQGETAPAYAVQEALGIDSVQATSSLRDAFDALEAGSQKYLVTDAVIGSYYARNYKDVVRVDYISKDVVTPIYAVTLSSNAELTQAVNETVTTLTQNGVLRVVAAKWLGTQAKPLLPGQVDISKLPTEAFGKK